MFFVLASCSVKEEKPNFKIDSTGNISLASDEFAKLMVINIELLDKSSVHLTLLQHIYLLEKDNFKNKELETALDFVFQENYQAADSVLKRTKIKAQEALGELWTI